MKVNNPSRVQSIDILRGLAMIVMALDHCRDFMHYDALMDQDPLDFSTTSTFLFLTRWITHFCAPTFVFLSGTSVFLFASKRNSKSQVAFYLVTRGLFLMFAEIFIIQPIWDFTVNSIYLQVIWAIGLSMVILAALQYLPIKLLLVIGFLILFGHNLLDPITIDSPMWKSMAWSIVHVQKLFYITDHFLVTVQYPFLPWLGLMILGYCTGKLFLPAVDFAFRKRVLFRSGGVAIFLFVLIRWINLYGDLHPWQSQKTSVFTLLDFVNTTKYPPSLLYCLMTVGPALILLSLFERSQGSITRRIMVFGKVPFFYYLLHVPLIHGMALLTFFARGHGWSDMELGHFRLGGFPKGSGEPLWYVYLAWALVTFILYFPCRWYSRYKSTHRQWWVTYI